MTIAFYQHVLLVDDDPVQIAILSAYFQSIGARKVSSAGNSLEALELLAQASTPVDLIVSDLQMPEMDGLEFLRHLKTGKYKGKLAIMSGVKSDILKHAANLAKLQNLNLIGQMGKPVSRASLDALFLTPEEPDLPETPVQDDQDTKAEQITPARLKQAINDGEIIPYYQPKIDTRTNRIFGAEALARWVDRDGNMIGSPGQFIPFAEECGLVEHLTFNLFETFLKDVMRFRQVNRSLHFAFNLSPSLMNDTSLPDRICSMMRNAGVPSVSVGFEITENAALDQNSNVLEVLSRLRIYDFEVSIDDFGTGHANIANLKDFPFTELKIDSSFVMRALSDSFSRQTVNAAVNLAKELDMPVVAEGVEDKETYELIKSLGIARVQGFLFSRALPPEGFIGYIEKNASGVLLAA